MKKLFIGFVAFLFCFGLNSCKKETPSTTSEKTSSTGQFPTAEKTSTGQTSTGEKTSTGQAPEDKKAVAENPSMSAADIVAKAKAEGANWTVDEWKAAFRDMLLKAKPMMVEIGEIEKNVDDKDPEKIMEALNKIQQIQSTKYGDINKAYEEFGKVAESTPNGKIVADDEKWGMQLLKELGISGD